MKEKSGSISEFEQEKINIEREKLDFEKKKQKLEWWKMGTGVPLIAAFITELLAFLGQFQKARDDFTLEAAEIVMSAQSPYGAANKAHALKALFPKKPSDSFSIAFNPESLYVHVSWKIDRYDFLHLLADRTNDPAVVIKYAKALFPEDSIIQNISEMKLSNYNTRSARTKTPAAD